MLQMVALNNNFQVCTYNLHGINQGSILLNYICTNLLPDVIFIQEHWQAPDNLHKIISFSPSYTGFGISAMEFNVQSGVLHGRPWGGCCTLVHSKYIKLINNVVCSERFVIIMIGSIAFVNLYLPSKSVFYLGISGGGGEVSPPESKIPPQKK